MLSFDKFRAVNKREKQSKEQNDRPSTASAASSAKNTNKQEETAVVGGKPSYMSARGLFGNASDTSLFLFSVSARAVTVVFC